MARIAAITVALVLISSSAFAACNPGSPNCFRVDPVLAKIKAQALSDFLNPPEYSCQGGGLCGNDSGGNPSPRPAVLVSSGSKLTAPVKK